MRFTAFFLVFSLWGADLDPKTEREYDRYIASAVQEMAAGPVRVAPAPGDGPKVLAWGEDAAIDIPSALIHDWVGAVFVPKATPTQAVALLTDFDRHAAIYAPEVSASKLISRQGDTYRSSLRLLKRNVITVVLDTEYETRYTRIGRDRWLGEVRSTRVQEVDNHGGKHERLKPVGTGQGFLWRLNSWWVVEPRDGGVLLQLRSVSLTRDIPFGLSWAIKPMVTSLPRESLISTLEKTAQALRGG
ncbi:MAG: hypothetical protein KJZ84_06720 [Bryobacteraceae bacterium]|nr:hypothetical protein [Bryobacteraceae bacterium]